MRIFQHSFSRVPSGLVCLALVLLAASARAGVQWESIGPGGGDLYGIEVSPANPNTVFALGFLSIFRSNDAAASWQSVHTTEMGAGLISLAFDPLNANHLYLSTNARGVFESQDQGDTWSRCDTGLPVSPQNPDEFYPVASLTVGPDQYVYAGLAQLEGQPDPPAWIYRSDGNCSWVADDTGIAFGAPTLNQDVAVLLSRDAADRVWAMVYGGGVYVNEGGAWQPANGDLPASALRGTYLAHHPADSGHLLLGTELDWIYESLDNGLTWSPIALPPALENLAVLPLVYNVALDPGNPELVYVLAIDATIANETPLFTPDFQTQTEGLGGYLSVDGGTSWPLIPIGAFVRLHFDSVETVSTDFPPFGPIERSRVWYGTSYGVENFMKTIDGGLTLEKSNNGIHSVVANTVWVHPAPPPPAQPMVFVGAESGLYQRIDQSPVWTQQYATPGIIYSWSFAPDPLDASSIYYSTGHPARAFTADRGIYRASLDCFGDGCALGQPLLSDTGVWRVVTSPLRPSTIYAATQDDGVLVSEDQGGSWSPLNDGLALPVSITDLALDDTGFPLLAAARTDNGDITAMPEQTWAPYEDENGGLYRYNAGQWSAVLGINTAVYALDADPANPQRFVAAAADGIHETLDGGQTWQSLFDLAVVNDVLLHPQNPAVLYAATGTGFLRSTDGGSQWHDLSEGLWQKFVLSLAIDDSGVVYAGTLGGAVFQLAPDPNPQPVITTDQDSLGFNAGPAGLFSEDLFVTITNAGEADLVIDSVVPGNPAFSLVDFPLPVTITPGGYSTLVVRFSPLLTSIVNGQVTIHSNDPVTPAYSIAVSGEGQIPDAAVPDLRLDSADGPITVANGAIVSVTGNLAAGDYGGQPADFWVRHTDPSGRVFWLVDGLGWIDSPTPLPLKSGTIAELVPYFAADLRTVATGTNEIMFAVDDNADGVFDGTWTDLATITVEALPPALLAGPMTLDFGQVNVGSTAATGFALISIGEQDLVVSAIDVNLPGIELFEAPTLPATVSYGGYLIVKVLFEPQTAGLVDGVITIHSNDPNAPTLDVQVSGEGLAAISPAPDVTLNGVDGPLSVASGSTVSVSNNLAAGSYAGQQADFWLRHTDPAGTVSWLVQGAGWVQSATPLPLFIGSIADASPYFSLTMAGLATGSHEILFAVDDNTDGVFDATWSDIATVSVEPTPPSLLAGPGTLDFGQVPTGFASERAFGFANTGEDDLIVTGIDVGNAAFELVDAPVFPATVSFGEQVIVRVRFTPSEEGTVNSALTIQSNDPVTPAFEIPVTGTGN